MVLSILKAYTGSSLGCSVVLTHSQSFPENCSSVPHCLVNDWDDSGPWRREENLLS